MVLYITTENNQEEMLWLSQQIDTLEFVIYDRRNNTIEQFVKTELRKYTTFSHLILDGAIFEENDALEEIIRSISYLCSAHIILIDEDILALEGKNVTLLANLSDVSNRQELLRLIKPATLDQILPIERQVTGKIREYSSEMEEIFFLKEKGVKLLCMGLQENEYNGALAMSLAGYFAGKNAQVNYTLIGEDEEPLEKLAALYGFKTNQDNNGYSMGNIEMYLNQANEDAHFIIMDFVQQELQYLNRQITIFLYTNAKTEALEQIRNVLPMNPLARVIICFFDVSDDEKIAIEIQLKGMPVEPFFIQATMLEDCLVKADTFLKPLHSILKGYFVVGQIVA